MNAFATNNPIAAPDLTVFWQRLLTRARVRGNVIEECCAGTAGFYHDRVLKLRRNVLLQKWMMDYEDNGMGATNRRPITSWKSIELPTYATKSCSRSKSSNIEPIVDE